MLAQTKTVVFAYDSSEHSDVLKEMQNKIIKQIKK